MKNPYDVEDTCRCHAWSEGECACGGYVDGAQVRAWQRGYDSGRAEVVAAIEALLQQVEGDARENQHLARLSTREVRAALSARDD